MLSNDFLGNDPPGRIFIPPIEQWLVKKASGFYTVCRKTMKNGFTCKKALVLVNIAYTYIYIYLKINDYIYIYAYICNSIYVYMITTFHC